ncbi:MAG TPA: hypothetical protein VFS21_40265 [Roseiflexaceae bacterium]|nr:hypothetical protein [Roseiflexaceae bacterium]
MSRELIRVPDPDAGKVEASYLVAAPPLLVYVAGAVRDVVPVLAALEAVNPVLFDSRRPSESFGWGGVDGVCALLFDASRLVLPPGAVITPPRFINIRRLEHASEMQEHLMRREAAIKRAKSMAEHRLSQSSMFASLRDKKRRKR